MTNGSNDRLDRIEELLQQSIVNSNARFLQLEQLAQSNSRAIQAMLDAQVTDRLQHEEFKERTATTINRLDATINRLDDTIQHLTTLNEGVVNMLGSLDEDRPTVLRKLNVIEGKIDRLLERNGNGDQPQP